VIKHESNCLLDKRVKCFSLRLLSKSFHPEYGAWFDQLDSESNKSLKVLTKWNLLIKIYLMLKDSINISLRYDSKNDRKTKGSEALYSFNATSLYSSERRHKIKTGYFLTLWSYYRRHLSYDNKGTPWLDAPVASDDLKKTWRLPKRSWLWSHMSRTNQRFPKNARANFKASFRSSM